MKLTSGMTAALAIAFAGLSLPQVAHAGCAAARIGAAAIRGPQYGGSNVDVDCAGAVTTNISEGNTGSATQLGPGNAQPSVQGAAYGGSGDTPTASSAYARANLSDASLHGSATSLNNAFANAHSQWSETLSFTNTSAENQYLMIGMFVEGDFNLASGGGGSVVSNFTISTRAQQGFQEGGLGYFFDSVTNQAYAINGNYNAFGWYPGYSSINNFGNTYAEYDLGGDSRLMTVLFGIAPGTHTVDLSAFLDITVSFGSTADYGNTAALQFGDLPTGVSFTSESGLFNPGRLAIPGVTSGVPEPTTWALMILGFAAIGGAMRRPRQRVQVRFV